MRRPVPRGSPPNAEAGTATAGNLLSAQAVNGTGKTGSSSQGRGLITRDTIEINLPKVESVDVRQSILGRLLNYGTVIVRGTGGGLNPLSYVSAPLPLRRAVQLPGQTSTSPA